MEKTYDVDWAMAAERYVDANIQHIMSEPNMVVPEVEDKIGWLHHRVETLAHADDETIQKIIKSKGSFWQFAQLYDMARSGIIRNFSFRLDSDSGRLLIFIEPLSSTRLMALNVPGLPGKKDPLVQ